MQLLLTLHLMMVCSAHRNSCPGSDHWSPAESRQFKKAYNKKRKDFSYIQSLLPKKSVHQCVEYYYTWKKVISLERQRGSAAEQSARTEQSYDGEEYGGSMREHRAPELKDVSYSSYKHTAPRTEPTGHFACKECDRVFDKVKSRNAHMKRHRQQKAPDLLQTHKEQLESFEQVPTSDINLSC